ncbi:MAG: tyrosine-type recombinase/integrase [Romboutsia sp.]
MKSGVHHFRKIRGEKLMRIRSLRKQFQYIIHDNFKENLDKRTIKQNQKDNKSEKIFSYTSKFNLLDFSKNFSSYMNENFTEVKILKDIKSEHIQSFLNYSAERVTDNTLITYVSYISKLQLCANKTLRANLSWNNNIVKSISIKGSKSPYRGVESVIGHNDFNKILNYCKNNRGSQSSYAIRLQDKLCIRVAEMATLKKKDIDFEKRSIKIANAKGGRSFERRNLDNETLEIFKDVINKNYHREKLFNCNSRAFNDYLRNVEDKLSIERYSFHDLRRCKAQEFYDSCREEGMSIKDAADSTAKYLNHNKNREEMLKESYIVLK